MKILIFTEGTAIMHAAAVGVSREERVKQSSIQIEGMDDFSNYVPNGRVVEKLNNWKSQGAKISYLTSRTSQSEVEDIHQLLNKYNFPDSNNLCFRKDGQEYKDVAEGLMPDVLIEDNCESIGGELEMTYPRIKSELKSKIHSIVTLEFAGIDNLPDDLNDLLRY